MLESFFIFLQSSNKPHKDLNNIKEIYEQTEVQQRFNDVIGVKLIHFSFFLCSVWRANRLKSLNAELSIIDSIDECSNFCNNFCSTVVEHFNVFTSFRIYWINFILWYKKRSWNPSYPEMMCGRKTGGANDTTLKPQKEIKSGS